MNPIKGMAQALLIYAKLLFTTQYAGHKVTPPGYLTYLLNNRAKLSEADLSGDKRNGHMVPVKVRYKQRITPDEITSSDDCYIEGKPVWKETSVTPDMFAKYAFYIPNNLIKQYANEASNLVKMGDPSKGIMNEFWEHIVYVVNGMVGKMDQDLLTKQALNFGVNQVTGVNTSTTVNFPLATTNNLSTGITKILSDAMANEFAPGSIDIVGSGLFNAYELQQIAKSADQAGLNTAALRGYSFNHDLYAQSKWGANQIGVFEKGAVQFLDINENAGNFGGDFGTAWLGTLDIPLAMTNADGSLASIKLDAHLKFMDCPTDVLVFDSGYGDYVSENLGKGFYLILSKPYGQFNMPSDSYQTSDRLTGNNGSLRYTITNV